LRRPPSIGASAPGPGSQATRSTPSVCRIDGHGGRWRRARGRQGGLGGFVLCRIDTLE
jgi:hypothetical protein